MIEITGINLIEFCKKVYELSMPQGLGMFHYTPTPLSDEEANEIVARSSNCSYSALSMDYVHGRACKMNVHKTADGKLMLPDTWYDHTDSQYRSLLKAFNIEIPANEFGHNLSCNCVECQLKRKNK